MVVLVLKVVASVAVAERSQTIFWQCAAPTDGRLLACVLHNHPSLVQQP